MIRSAARQSFSIFWAFSFLVIVLLDRKNVFANAGIDGTVVLAGNFIIFLATFLSFVISKRSIDSANPNAAVRSLYGSFMIKFFVIAIAAFAYIMAVKKQVNKPALVICAGLYLIYSFLEVASVQKLLKQKKNA